MTDTQDVLISFVLDKSSSMLSVTKETIEGFNHFIKEQRELPGTALLSLTLFDTRFDVRYVAAPLASVPALGDVDNPYGPSGMTALYDAVGTTIKGTEKWVANHPEFKGKVSVVILTDGQENSSHEWHCGTGDTADDKDLNGLIKWKQNEGWDFIFLGSGQASWLEAANFHAIPKAMVFNTGGSRADTVSTYAGLSQTYSGSRAGGQSLRSSANSSMAHLRADKSNQDTVDKLGGKAQKARKSKDKS